MKKYFVVLTLTLSLLFGLSAASAEDKCSSLQKALDQYEVLFLSGSNPNTSEREQEAVVSKAADQWEETIKVITRADLDLVHLYIGFMIDIDRFLKAAKFQDSAAEQQYGMASRAKLDQMRQKCPNLRFLSGGKRVSSPTDRRMASGTPLLD